MTVMDVCLISPPSRANTNAMPFGLLYVGSYLKSSTGISPEIIDIKVKDSPLRSMSGEGLVRLKRRILERIDRCRPRLIGITCLVTEVMEVRSLSADIKREHPGVTIVAGGIHPTMFPEDLLYAGSAIDYVVIGEGEETFSELVISIKDGKSVEKVPGLAWMSGEKLCRSATRLPITDLDRIPRPLFERIDMDFYLRPCVDVIRNMYLSVARIFTSRGCPSQCTFCVNKNLHRIMGCKKSFRQRSVKDVLGEIEYLAKKYAIDGFYLCDDMFCVHKGYTMAFCKELKRSKLNLVWATETKANLVSHDVILAMKDAGCVQIDFGVESGSQEVLNRMKKGITIEQVRNAFRWCHELGVRPMANIMFNTPGESKEDVEMTWSLAEEIDACYYAFNLMTPFPGTDIYKDVQPPLRVDEYELLRDAYTRLTDKRFRCASHSQDLDKLVWRAHLSFNTISKRMSFIFNGAYLRRLMRSGRKLIYIRTLIEIFGRLIDYYWMHFKYAICVSRSSLSSKHN